jgi:hypothetical protein
VFELARRFAPKSSRQSGQMSARLLCITHLQLQSLGMMIEKNFAIISTIGEMKLKD